MQIQRAILDDCGTEQDTVVCIDVLRVFTTAAYALGSGAEEIVLAGTVQEALELREQFPGSLIVGEADGGYPALGFDYGNLASAVVGLDLTGRRLIMRSQAGTQGVLCSADARRILGCSLVCAGATASYIRAAGPESVTLLQTGVRRDGRGEEDVACADLIEQLLLSRPVDREDIVRRVRESRVAQRFKDPDSAFFPHREVDLAVDIDRFDFAMVVSRRADLFVMHATRLASRP